VPTPTVAPTPITAGPLDGPPSSLAEAKIDAGVTLEQPCSPDHVPVHELLARRPKGGGRYVLDAEVARGGMGAVFRAVDGDIRREVAIKYLLDQNNPRQRLRFIEEAQITGQLEHPAIVPIHELGLDARQRLFFSMKMVRGRSLAQVLEELRQSPGAGKLWPLSRLLTVFVSVCHALAYAHSRGVIHRDLKPANIMLGDFGEVYVMDWGIAKVLARESRQPPEKSATAAALFAEGSHLPRTGSVATIRDGDADLTQDGAVLGTPVYMPPEQARGDVHRIGRCSDVYALGAVLYELLTLHPPVAKDGYHVDILCRVIDGKIEPPEQRAPERARQGNIPAELAAVALKALALRPEDRYPSVEALRRDVERFQEGRSVSAKSDTTREMLWKLVKRNKGFSAAAALIAVILVAGSVVNYQARVRAEAAQAEQDRRTRAAVPALVGAARYQAENRDLDGAMEQLETALSYDRDYPPAHLLKAQIRVARLDFTGARADLERYLQLRPRDAGARELAQLCEYAQPDDGKRLLQISDVLVRQQVLGLSNYLIQEVAKLRGMREQLIPLLRKRIDKSWAGLGDHLLVRGDGALWLNLAYCGNQVNDLAPLAGMPLNAIDLTNCERIGDLKPLQGMPLTELNLYNCRRVSDLAPLQGMKLTSLNLTACKEVRDLSPLQGMKLTSLVLASCREVADLTPLRGMPLTDLNLTYCLRVQDLTPLRDMRLTNLDLAVCSEVRDLAPLRGMPLKSLSLMSCAKVTDLAPLEGMPLRTLYLSNCVGVADLAPLRNVPLTNLDLSGCVGVRDLSPLRRMPLTHLGLASCIQVTDLAPLEGMPLVRLYLESCDHIKDLRPLEGLPLEEVILTPYFYRKESLESLKRVKALKFICTTGLVKDKYPTAEFWRKYEAGDFNKK
jgi:serine/threonine protein kinase